MNHCTRILFALLISLAAFGTFANAAIYVGTCGGYIFYMNSTLAPGSSVTINVAGCSGGGCSSSSTSQSNGYYVVANLNLPAAGTANGVATNGPYSGTNSSIANSEYAAFMNITLCRPPSTPVLTPQPDTHYGNVSLAWVNGTDYDGYPTYTQFQLDSGAWTVTSSPYAASGLSFAAHSWNVRTCNALCCSALGSDSFNVYNNPPSVPQLVLISDSNESSVSLNWASGVDPDGDGTYDQYGFRRFDQSYTTTNATPPINKSSLSGSYFWRVRTCDQYDWCSDWNESSFTVSACSGGGGVCPVCPSGGGGGGYGECPKAFNVLTLAPSVVQDGAAFIVDVTLENKDYFGALNYLSFEVESPTSEVSITPIQVARLNSGQSVHVALPGEARLGAASGSDKTFTLKLKIYKNSKLNLIYETQFDVRVVQLAGVTPSPAASPTPCPACPWVPGCRLVCQAAGATITPQALGGRAFLEVPNWLWLLAVLLILITLAAWLWRRRKKQKKPRPGLLAFVKE